MISDLPLGERLNIKGKLFELQKKLQTIDLGQKLDEKYPYKPQISSNYDLPNRQPSFLENIQKAEIIRKQKKELLARSAVMMAEENCTFSPNIYTKGKRAAKAPDDDRPVHERLTEKGKQYQESHQRRAEYYSSIDLNDGSRLFAPRITPQSASRDNQGGSETDQHNAHLASADEFLYQDAKDRELRLQQLTSSYAEQLAQSANVKKMSKTSEQLLHQRADKQARKLYGHFCRGAEGSEISYEMFVQSLQDTSYYTKLPLEQQVHLNQLAWRIFTHYEGQGGEAAQGGVSPSDFTYLTKALLLYNSVGQMCQYLQEKEEKRIRKGGARGHRGSYLGNVKKSEVLEVKKLIEEIIKELESKHSSQDQSISISVQEEESQTSKLFTPHIYSYSYKLANKKEQKEQDLLSTVLSPADESNDVSTVNPSTVNSKKSTLPDRLLARGKVSQLLKEEKIEEIRQKELEECTFKPTLKATYRRQKQADKEREEGGEKSVDLDSSRDLDLGPKQTPPPPPSTSPNSLPVHERLYNTSKQRKGESVPLNTMQELKYCTFHPTIKPVPAYINNPAPPIPGYTETVQRYRAVVETKVKQKELEEKQHEMNHISYLKSREVAKKGPEPFHLSTHERYQQQKEKTEIRSSKPSLIIDVKLGGSVKNARIKISHGDDPHVLAERFGKIYGLDQNAIEVLASVVKKSMVRSGLIHSRSVSPTKGSFYSRSSLGGEGFGGGEDEGDRGEYSSYTMTESEEEQEEGLGVESEGEASGLSGSESEGRYGGGKGNKKRKNRNSMRSSLLSQLL